MKTYKILKKLEHLEKS